ncbi:enoyl-ACP reductase FabV [Rheinheimera aquimaris]|jgi:enoyl-[acyl-carrier protein] reductase/trans-2-enoyl-CoA reductase (NAD+)|uniref:Enoyl-[acyl-carrier-protein] reductase [NADH] n=1 Tax=Rheinheimera aquimaris TaxID=412437 RepID=A0ABN1DTU7_9GAMM|nr:enoyl-ACP reductase FabV [Rheinheimera aquimaris]MCB5214141.1 trans-2-enoyl-CoA reductase family protein [Rheinheimera aquimaris]MCD1597647.1 trans-2-enoyl-CoA reductase family protein [Rheinheimera aquimaris]|tara:strand:- start:15998 stop:17191 length:1194 start_codon:yes stop_codon:yes gene_type:complete
MVIQPKIRGFICTNAHPVGCAEHVKEQIEYVKALGPVANGPKNVLVIGSSTGYGLASRITAAFGSAAKTLGIFFEKEPTENKTASAGWYNTAAFEQAANAAGLWNKHLNGDAFTDELKSQAIDIISKEMGKIDLVVYSLAAPRRKDPVSGEVFSSVLKPIGQSYTARTLNTSKREIEEVSVEPANDDEIYQTVKVMGGEDWERWLDQLNAAGVLADNCQTVAYTYIGKELTWPIYGKATIGKAKEDLDRAASAITDKLSAKKGKAYVASLKALVTQASSAIPIMPLYISLLYRVMKEEGTHEGCIEQINGLFRQGLYSDAPLMDDAGRLRMDGKELSEHIQQAVKDLWGQVTTDTIDTLTDYKGYHNEFLRLFGFGYNHVDYDADVSPMVPLHNIAG